MTTNLEISKAFSKSVDDYEIAAKVQQEIGNRLLERLQYINLNPRYILDLGCGPGGFSRALKNAYPKAQVVALDLSLPMLKKAKTKMSWRRKWSLLAADMVKMPLPSGLFDLVFANQAVHWGSSLKAVFREINRVMTVNGCFMFTTLGPDTFIELKKAWSGVNEHAHVNEFLDMHDVGDCLLSERFVEPVVDMENLSVHYDSLDQLVRSLKAQGVKNINPQRNQGLTGKRAWQEFKTNYSLMRLVTGKFPLSYEVVYGHAWKGEQRNTDSGVETFVPLSKLVKPR
ncbi:malonyl-ACP O-methyltransferase BioC [Legionella waltersii]|uniref:Malonyl-[acyl-carrier protein] O-methyltransferase n=1 Tax=Legionella waltersii TaxID=66969 RepID=A0A0W1AGW3_9GAMM|nr:malonyl-ACP O-methyltransferase BioC [Legionella waltersii]KTD80500.1 biotin synthase BioC [Legionella waltersii]SNV09629.1 biotin synthase BioC [Legionella waltersii]